MNFVYYAWWWPESGGDNSTYTLWGVPCVYVYHII